MKKYIVLVQFGQGEIWAVSSNVKVDSENNLYTDLNRNLNEAIIFEDYGQALKNVKTTLKFNPDYKVIKVVLK